MLLWLWSRWAAAAPIQPLVWELRDASGVALKKKTSGPGGKPAKALLLRQVRAGLARDLGLI